MTHLTSLGVPDWILGHDVTCRPNYALYLGADAYISIHANINDTSSSGTMSLVWGPDMSFGDPDSGILPTGTLNLATTIHTQLVGRIRSGWDSEWYDHGIRAVNLGELRMIQNAWVNDSNIAVPAVMLELGYVDNCDNDALLLKENEYRNSLSYSVLKGVVDYFSDIEETTAHDPPMNVINLTASIAGDSINLTWENQVDDDASADSVTEYYFIYSSADGSVFTTPPVSTRTMSYTFKTNEIPHLYFKVTAYNSHGESSDSAIVHAE